MSILLSLLLSLPVPTAPTDTWVPSVEEQRLLLSQHYAVVLEELESADTTRLSDVQRASRCQLLDALRAYRARADFGRNDELTAARVPFFVDSEGRRCAVAELLHVSGEMALVERVRNDLEPRLDPGPRRRTRSSRAGSEQHGLDFEEAARIHGPSIPPMRYIHGRRRRLGRPRWLQRPG
jgi:hypothetical protein